MTIIWSSSVDLASLSLINCWPIKMVGWWGVGWWKGWWGWGGGGVVLIHQIRQVPPSPPLTKNISNQMESRMDVWPVFQPSFCFPTLSVYLSFSLLSHSILLYNSDLQWRPPKTQSLKKSLLRKNNNNKCWKGMFQMSFNILS